MHCSGWLPLVHRCDCTTAASMGDGPAGLRVADCPRVPANSRARLGCSVMPTSENLQKLILEFTGLKSTPPCGCWLSATLNPVLTASSASASITRGRSVKSTHSNRQSRQGGRHRDQSRHGTNLHHLEQALLPVSDMHLFDATMVWVACCLRVLRVSGQYFQDTGQENMLIRLSHYSTSKLTAVTPPKDSINVAFNPGVIRLLGHIPIAAS